MLSDGRGVAGGTELVYDVCVVGAGPAGLVVADGLSQLGLHVGVVETGTAPADATDQRLSDVEVDAGDEIYLNPRHYRSRALGGTATRWCIETGGAKQFRVAPLHRSDFEKRPWFEHSGWPLSIDDLAPWYRRAEQLCGARPTDLPTDSWAGPDRRPLFFPQGLAETTVLQFAPQSTFVDALPARLAARSTVDILTGSTAVELLGRPDGSGVDRIRVRTLGGNEFLIRARTVVLCQGGFEVARLLLASTGPWPGGLGNEHDLVGRFFMDHQILNAGRLDLHDPGAEAGLGFYDIWEADGAALTGALSVADAVLDREHLARSAFLLVPRPEHSLASLVQHVYGRDTTSRSPAVRSVVELRRAVKYHHRPPEHLPRRLVDLLGGLDDVVALGGRLDRRFQPPYSIDVGGWHETVRNGRPISRFDLFQVTEQRPDPENRLQLTPVTDVLGMPRARLTFRWAERDRRDACRSQDVLAEALIGIGVGRFRPGRRRGDPLVRQMSAHHPSGTTRMATDPRDGVVDADCRVHGVDNVYVASSSVFPTCGYAPPTLTILALALRVADRVATDAGVMGHLAAG